jgi:hypothetical protein
MVKRRAKPKRWSGLVFAAFGVVLLCMGGWSYQADKAIEK